MTGLRKGFSTRAAAMPGADATAKAAIANAVAILPQRHLASRNDACLVAFKIWLRAHEMFPSINANHRVRKGQNVDAFALYSPGKAGNRRVVNKFSQIEAIARNALSQVQPILECRLS